VVYGRQEAFDRYAAAGGWVAIYSGDVGVIGNAWSAHRGVFFLRFVPGPESVRDRIRSYAEAGFRGLYVASSIYAGGIKPRLGRPPRVCGPGQGRALAANLPADRGGRV